MGKERGVKGWLALIEAQSASGLSVRSFCQEHKVSPRRFYHWRKRLLASPRGGEEQKGAQFIPFAVPSFGKKVSPIVLSLPYGITLTIDGVSND